MKRLLTLLTLILSVTLVMGQELTVKNFALAPQDLTASTQRRNDNNGQACALIKVQLARPGATFHGNVMGNTPYSQSVYMVYMMKGSKMLEVRLDDYLPVMIDFEKDWGIKGVESLATYVLSITLPNVVSQSNDDDDGMSYFTLLVTPKNASVQLDGKIRTLAADGSLLIRLNRGSHSFQVSAEGYETYQETFTLGVDKKNIKVNLVSTMATLSVKCATPDADIYINDVKRGSNSYWSGTLTPGNYLVDARKEGYYLQQQSVELSPKQSRTIELPALKARVGRLDVAYRPVDAEVWIDGEKKGTSPDVFKNLGVGSHRVEIRKDGYTSETKTVTIEEGKTFSLSGSLTERVSSSAASSSTSTSSMSNDKKGNLIFTVNGVSFTMIRVEGGTFTMGATGSDAYVNEKPAHQVTLSTYSIGETEVTQELWQAVMGSNPSWFKGTKLPVEQVNWQDCQEFIRKLNATTGKSFRLPTEAEWEYAARGGNRSRGYKYAGSNSLDNVAWYDKNSENMTHNVAQKKSNELGLYDMNGNVWEWCLDWYDSYRSIYQTNPHGPRSGSDHVFRGGSWLHYSGSCRLSYRYHDVPGYRHFSLGLRLALSE